MKWAGQDTDHLHVALFLFIAGSLIYLFNINRAVFYAVVWSVGYMAISYAGVTVTGAFEPHDLFFTPLSRLVLFIYFYFSYAAFQVSSYTPSSRLRDITKGHYHDLRRLYSKGFLKYKRREAKEFASKNSSEVDAWILERILPNLDADHHSPKKFFDAIPGFCDLNSSGLPLSPRFCLKLGQALYGYLDRTFSSNSDSETRRDRLITCLNAAHAALKPYAVSGILIKLFQDHRDGPLKSVEIGLELIRWAPSQEYLLNIQLIVAYIITCVQERDAHWTMLVNKAFGVPDCVLREDPEHRDSVLLSILIHTSRQVNSVNLWRPGVLSSLSKFNICSTTPKQQHKFCAMWNEFVKHAHTQGSHSTPIYILREIFHLYHSLHDATDPASTAFHVSTPPLDPDLYDPSSYHLCEIPSHHPDSPAVPPQSQPGDATDASPRHSTSGGGTILQIKKATTSAGLPPPSNYPNATTPGELGNTRQRRAANAPTLRVHTSLRRTDAPRAGAVPATLLRIPWSSTLSHPFNGTRQRDIVTPVNRDNMSIVPTHSPAPTPTPAPVPPSTSLVSSEPDAEFRGMAPSSSTGNTTLPRLRARGLVNTGGNMCFANAVLQLLVHSPPFYNLFKELDLKGKPGEGGPETGGSTTPVVDATIRFFEEFGFKELPATLRAAGGNPREGQEAKKQRNAVDPFNPTNMYDAMKTREGQLKNLLVRCRAT